MREREVSIFCLSFLSLLLLTMLEALFVAPGFGATTRYVPTQYPTIQAALNAANTGDTIFVYNGSYREHLIVNTRSVTLTGENKTTTIIDGSGTGTVVDIRADGVTVQGFTIQNGGDRYDGVIIESTFNNILISGNIIKNNVEGVSASDSNGVTITGNTFFNNSIYGITLTSSLTNTIANNVLSESSVAIKLDFANETFIKGNSVSSSSYGIYVASSTNNTVADNTLSSNSFGILAYVTSNTIVRNNTVSGSTYAIELHTSTVVSVLNNTLTNNPSYSIYLAYSNGNTIKGNTVSGSDWGIQMYDSDSNTISQNRVSNNTYGFYLVAYSVGNTLYYNDIINNVKQAFRDLSSFTNTWNTPTTPYQGNYWSDYKGSDTNGDGIGDTYLPWAGVDYYPLINPFGLKADVAILSVVPSRDRTYQGVSMNITVVTKNLGTTAETFNVTAYYNQSVIGTKKVTSLTPGTNSTLVFTWNTIDASIGYYVISVNATIVPFETNTANNNLTDGTVRVKIPGDINGDNYVDIFDAASLSLNYGRPASEFPDGDINGDGFINILDAIVIVGHWTG